MKIETLKIHRKTAEKKYKEYLQAVKDGHPDKTYKELKEAFYHAKNGRKLIDVSEVIKNAGCDENGYPNLAIIRADAENCFYRAYDRHVTFFMDHWYPMRGRGTNFSKDTFKTFPDKTLKAIVPSIPPRFRPKGSLYRYYILWEADWHEVPVDPILLKRVSKYLFVVLATWNLTKIERTALK